MDFAALWVEAHPVARLGTEPLLHRNPKLGEDREQLLVRTDPRAARGEIVGHALVDVDFPTQVAEQVAGEEPAERPTDDDRAWHSEVLEFGL
jgi:hypothetical protein